VKYEAKPNYFGKGTCQAALTSWQLIHTVPALQNILAVVKYVYNKD
jgi:hypothetical protein